MEVYDDRPASVYDNLKTTNDNRAIHTSTPKAVGIVKSAESTPTAAVVRSGATTSAIAANGATSSPIYADITFKFNDNQLLTDQQQSQQPLLQQQRQQQQQQTLPCLSRQNQPQSTQQQQPLVASNFTDHTTTASALHFPTNTTLATPENINKNNNSKYTNSKNQRLIQPNTSITMPAPVPAPAPAPASVPPPALASSTSAAPLSSSATAYAAVRNASPTQRPLSQHSQSELYEASQSIAAVKAALNDAKSKFFGLNGYAQDPVAQQPQQQQFTSPTTTSSRLLIDNQYPKVQIVTTAPTPPPKTQPTYQNIPENSAIFRSLNNGGTPPALPPKPSVDAVGMPSRMTAAATTSPTQPDGAVSMAPDSAAFPSSSRQSNTPSPSPSSPSDAAKVSLSSSHAAYKQIPLNDIDTLQPSQAVYMSTTVPQNIKAAQHPNPMNFKYPNLARWLLILEIIVGLLISFLAIWIFCLAPNTAIQYNPYWSGLVLLLAGILGLVLVRYQRIKRHKVRENCFKFLRADTYLLALLAVLLCVVALFCATLHYARLCASDTHCASTNILLEQGSCTCTFNVNEAELATPAANSSSVAQLANGLLDEEVPPETTFSDQSYKVEYRDLSCKEVRGVWITILILSITFNSIGFLLAFAYTMLIFCCRLNGNRPIYASVHTSNF
ncbi:mucin-5AC isoform X2 [Ceratitis capitata]|uniref:mucin-5AC isoform X2 n=1 Tax=Ceratitis capitata TaxID=7213 RepID=UPI00032A14BF|nr:mucin-5AC isoform X2 [Ceratitis capitata]